MSFILFDLIIGLILFVIGPYEINVSIVGFLLVINEAIKVIIPGQRQLLLNNCNFISSTQII